MILTYLLNIPKLICDIHIYIYIYDLGSLFQPQTSRAILSTKHVVMHAEKNNIHLDHFKYRHVVF